MRKQPLRTDEEVDRDLDTIIEKMEKLEAEVNSLKSYIIWIQNLLPGEYNAEADLYRRLAHKDKI